MNEPRITLLTRKNCHLCEQARASLNKLQATTGHTWQERDVDANDELAYEYGDRVPVTLLDGNEHGYWTVDQNRLLADLQSRPGKAQ